MTDSWGVRTICDRLVIRIHFGRKSTITEFTIPEAIQLRDQLDHAVMCLQEGLTEAEDYDSFMELTRNLWLNLKPC